MALKKIIVVAAMVVGAQAFASARVEEALTLNQVSVKADKSKAKLRVIDSLNKSELQKTELPKNARHDATAGVFI